MVFNSNQEEPQKLAIRPEGIQPGAENDEHFIEAETEATYEGVSVTPYGKIEPGTYDLYWKNEKISTLHLAQGGVHTFVVDASDEENPTVLDFLLSPENSVHILWLIPQFFVITVGEIMISITALEFSYSQVFFSSHFLFPLLQIEFIRTVFFSHTNCIIFSGPRVYEIRVTSL